MSRPLLAIIVAAAVSSCVTESAGPPALRETLPNGALLVRYPDLPAIDDTVPEVTEAQVDLRLGSLEGRGPESHLRRHPGRPGRQRRHHLRAGPAGHGSAGLTIRRAGTCGRSHEKARGRARLTTPTAFSSPETPCCGSTITAQVGDYRGGPGRKRGSPLRLKPVRSYGYIWNGSVRPSGALLEGDLRIRSDEIVYPPPPGLSHESPTATTTSPTTCPAEQSTPSSSAKVQTVGPTHTPRREIGLWQFLPIDVRGGSEHRGEPVRGILAREHRGVPRRPDQRGRRYPARHRGRAARAAGHGRGPRRLRRGDARVQYRYAPRGRGGCGPPAGRQAHSGEPVRGR